jgi:hypothetical protein
MAIPAAAVLSWVFFEYVTRAVWHSDLALLGAVLLVLATQAFTLAGMSLLAKNTERRMIQEIRNQNSKSIVPGK